MVSDGSYNEALTNDMDMASGAFVISCDCEDSGMIAKCAWVETVSAPRITVLNSLVLWLYRSWSRLLWKVCAQR